MRSLQSRLVLTAVALVALVAVLIAAATTVAMRSWLTDRLDAEVVQALERTGGPGPGGLGPPSLDGGAFEPRRGQGVGTLMARLDPTTYHGEVITGSGYLRLSSTALTMLEDVPVDGEVHEVDLPGVGDYRVAASSEPTGGVIVAGLPADQVGDVVSSLLTWQALLTLLGIAAAAAAGVVVVRRQLAPLREVADIAHEVAALPLDSGEIDLSPRVSDTDERTEIGRVGAALNAMLAHVEGSLEARHRSEQQVRRFVADASHELRTPLATIRGHAELARRTPDDAARLSEGFGKVEAAAGRMSTLVEDLLLLARLDAGRPLAREEVDVTRLLLEAVADARVVSSDHDFRMDLPAQVLTVPGDEQRLHQVVANLLANARTHTPPGTTVSVSARRVDGDVEVVVADDGPGFPEELVDSAFDRFTRGDGARSGSGAGLGLSIVDAIVRAHGGSVRLASRPGDTRVLVRLPGLTAA